VGTLGNHDFDYGWMQARKFMETAKYPIVSANVVSKTPQGEQLFTAKPYVILKVNGLRVAIIGAMTDSLDSLTTPQLLQQWHTVPVVETARRYARELKSQSDLIVLLGHITGPEELKILAEVPEIPVLVTGHVHAGLPQPLTQDGRIVVRVRGYGEEFGRLELKVDTEMKAVASYTWKHIPVDSTAIAPDATSAAAVKRWEDEVSARVDQPLAVRCTRVRQARRQGPHRAGDAHSDRRRFRFHEPRRRARCLTQGATHGAPHLGYYAPSTIAW
jgi:2',3'-cyclic-nucleotide 2'-phosphodiesterase (5'-nucleotidase family)